MGRAVLGSSLPPLFVYAKLGAGAGSGQGEGGGLGEGGGERVESGWGARLPFSRSWRLLVETELRERGLWRYFSLFSGRVGASRGRGCISVLCVAQSPGWSDLGSLEKLGEGSQSPDLECQRHR